jgi:hypothetical protein
VAAKSSIRTGYLASVISVLTGARRRERFQLARDDQPHGTVTGAVLYAVTRRGSDDLPDRACARVECGTQFRKMPERTAFAPAVGLTVMVTVPPAATLIGNVTHAP